MRDLFVKYTEEKKAADPDFQSKEIAQAAAEALDRAKVTPPIFTSLAKYDEWEPMSEVVAVSDLTPLLLCRYMLETNMHDHADDLVDLMRKDQVRPESAGAIALYDLFVKKFEGRADRALDKMRALKASHELDAITFDKVVRHASGQTN